jgi:hypothetical protein
MLARGRGGLGSSGRVIEPTPDYTSLGDAALRQYHDMVRELMEESGKAPLPGDRAEWRAHVRGIEAELARRGLGYVPLPGDQPPGA